MTKNKSNNSNRKGNRPANKPHRVARSNDQTTSRKFRAISRIFFQDDGESGVSGTQGAFAYTFPVSSYTGSDFISDNFEQYQVSNVEILMKPSASTLNNGNVPSTTLQSIQYQNSVYSAMNSTYVQSFIDYDSETNPSFTDCQTRPNLKVRALQPNNWTKIASFKPKTLSNQSFGSGAPSNNFENVWMTTSNLDAQLFGVRGVCNNPSPTFDTQDNVMSVDVRLTITVRMRGPKNSNSSSNVAVLPNFYIIPKKDDPKIIENHPDDPPPLRLGTFGVPLF